MSENRVFSAFKLKCNALFAFVSRETRDFAAALCHPIVRLLFVFALCVALSDKTSAFYADYKRNRKGTPVATQT